MVCHYYGSISIFQFLATAAIINAASQIGFFLDRLAAMGALPANCVFAHLGDISSGLAK
jgi:hypothetical protein